ncbi:chromate transporter [Flammeovirgaceae bacterium SG7u.111]|nr:chromate transporter [Flammeovirgaceae bacterium SG7u.132]WPO37730.1 chromate transporter [Flammeovirgaceae bacterium SG7u.111]
MKDLFELVKVFFKIGLFSFGGGLAMVPLFIVEFEAQGWMTSDEFFDVLSLAQMTPGAIAMNSATFVGNSVAGVLGGITATSALAAPSVIIMLLLSKFLQRVKNNKFKEALFKGLKPVTVALILFAGWQIANTTYFEGGDYSLVNWKAIGLSIAVGGALLYFKKVNPIFLILASGVIGVILF